PGPGRLAPRDRSDQRQRNRPPVAAAQRAAEPHASAELANGCHSERSEEFGSSIVTLDSRSAQKDLLDDLFDIVLAAGVSWRPTRRHSLGSVARFCLSSGAAPSFGSGCSVLPSPRASS